MPQQSLLNDHPAMTRLELRIKSFPHTKHPDQVDIEIRCAVGSEAVKTRYVCSLTHNERDYLNTMVTEVTMAYMYGETPRDLCVAAASVRKLARFHEHSTSP